MSRDALVEKAARVGAELRRGPTAKVNGTDLLIAAAVVDAILPQVSTVEELDALADDVWLMSDRLDEPVLAGDLLSSEVAKFGPLTIVWQR